MEESINYLKTQFQLPDVDIRTYSPQVLAYIGDGIYELIIRTVLVGKGNCQANDLHRKASGYVKVSAQAAMVLAIREELTEDEHHRISGGAMPGHSAWRSMRRWVSIVRLRDLRR